MPYDILKTISDILWGPYLLIPLLLGTGLYLTICLKGLQFKKLFYSLWLAFIVRKEPGKTGDISHFQALMTALSATVGSGNIVGVATAIALGGPGALFWMWMTGFVGMATKYAEALLSVKYRITNARGEQSGGPMYYLSRGITWKKTGYILSVLFATFAVLAAFGVGSTVQSNSIASALEQAFSIPLWVSGLVIAIVAGIIVFGGIKSIGGFSSVFVPLMILLYFIATISIIFIHITEVPDAFLLIIKSAFTGTAATGGFIGASLAYAIRFGVARGLFSNESGMGSAGIAAAAAQTDQPVTQALVSMTQTFLDTIVICTLTGLVIILTGAWTSGLNGAPLTQLAFNEGLGTVLGGWIVAISLTMFAFSTILGWCYYGEKCIEYLLGIRAVFWFKGIFILATFYGAVETLDIVWLFSDIANGLMALPNLLGLLLLSHVIFDETKVYFKNH